jgi:tetratricopeptide (TPR) repeat protein
MTTESDVRELLAAGEEALTEAAFCTGDFGKARELLESAHASVLAGNGPGDADADAEAAALSRLGMLAHYENITAMMSGSQVGPTDIDAEEKLFRRALARWQQAGEPADAAEALFGLGLVFQVLHSDWITAMPYFWQALGLVTGPEAAGGTYLRSEVHRHVGFYFLVEDVRPAEAVRHLQISLDLREELGDPRRIPSGLVALAEAELQAGGRDRAIELLTRAVADARAAGLLPARIEDAERKLAEAEIQPETEVEFQPETMAEFQPETVAEAPPETVAEAPPETEAEGEPEPEAEPETEPKVG